MILNKAEIKTILKNTEYDFEHTTDGLYITTVEDAPFDKNTQIGEDSIDLRIGSKGSIYNNEYKFINTLLSVSTDHYFEEVELSLEKGYDLKPGDLLFINTVERIALKGNYIGYVTGRSTFAKFGISVHCTQEKFSTGNNAIVSLQIKNNSNVTLKIWPYQKLAQIIIHQLIGTTPYIGPYCNDTKISYPQVSIEDRQQYVDDHLIDRIDRIKSQKKSRVERLINSNFRDKISLYQSIISFIIAIMISYIPPKSGINLLLIIFLVSLYVVWSKIAYDISTENRR